MVIFLLLYIINKNWWCCWWWWWRDNFLFHPFHSESRSLSRLGLEPTTCGTGHSVSWTKLSRLENTVRLYYVNLFSLLWEILFFIQFFRPTYLETLCRGGSSRDWNWSFFPRRFQTTPNWTSPTPAWWESRTTVSNIGPLTKLGPCPGTISYSIRWPLKWTTCHYWARWSPNKVGVIIIHITVY